MRGLGEIGAWKALLGGDIARDGEADKTARLVLLIVVAVRKMMLLDAA